MFFLLDCFVKRKICILIFNNVNHSTKIFYVQSFLFLKGCYLNFGVNCQLY